VSGSRIGLAAIALLLAGAPAAHAQGEPLSPPGVRVHLRARGAVVTFDARAAKLYHRLRGRKVTLRCVLLGPPDALLREDRGESDSIVTPRRRRPLHFDLPSRRFDFCLLARADGTGDAPISVALTPRGTTFLDEQQATFRMVGVLAFAGSLAPNGSNWPLADRVVAAGAGQIAALAGPGESPPPGKVGYYSDGARHVTVAVLSRAGRRLFIDSNGDVTSTNVLEYLNEG
jgi:hypothetical protein